MALSAPEPLSDAHDLNSFQGGGANLDDWLRRRARANHLSGASRCFVVCDAARVVAFYALASGGLTTAAASGRFRRNMPEPIPVAVIGRLAVDRDWQGRGVGRALIRDAAMRLSYASDSIGIRGVVVHAISEQAKAFCTTLGFVVSPAEPMTLMMTLGDLRAAISRP